MKINRKSEEQNGTRNCGSKQQRMVSSLVPISLGHACAHWEEEKMRRYNSLVPEERRAEEKEKLKVN